MQFEPGAGPRATTLPPALLLLGQAGEEELGRVREALQPDLADQLELEVRYAAASTTGRVTSTSPPAARAATRAARLTSRP